MPKVPTYAVIMAGGQGTRFWPASRQRRPKQFLPILGQRTMLQETAARVRPLFPPERLLVVTGAEHAALVRRQLPDLPAANLLVEPVGRNTAPCIALAAEVLLGRHEDALMAVLPADHAIADRKAFLTALRRALRIAAGEDCLVTIGVRPSYAETGYGYVEVGGVLDARRPRSFWARAFHEKPAKAAAAAYVRSGRFLWNSGMFAWRASVIREQVAGHLPATARALAPVAKAKTRRARDLAIRRAYARVDAISIDHGILEKAERVAVVSGDFGWNDVGSWAALPAVWASDAGGNAVRGQVVAVDAGGNVVWGGGRLVALLGMHDCVVVDTDDAVLVCPRERAQEVRRLLEELRRRRLEHLL